MEEYENARLECVAGSLLVVPQGLAHEDCVGPFGARTLSVELGARMLHRIGESVALFERPRVVGGAGILHGIERLSAEFRARDDASLLAIAAITLDLIVLAERTTSAPNASRPWLTELVEELHRNPTDEPSLSRLAPRFGVSEAQMARAFRRRHGCSIGEYVRWLRLERSKRDLAGDSTIAAVAVDCGFYDQAHFSRLFKKRYGLSPSDFRRHVHGASRVQEGNSASD